MFGRNGATAKRDGLHEAIVAAHRREPALSPTQIGDRIGCSHVTVRRVLRAHGLYVRSGSEKPSTPQTEAEMVRVLKASITAAKGGR